MFLRLAALSMFALLLAGCGGDAGTQPPPPGPAPLLNTPDDVIEGLRVAWESHDTTLLEPLLADDFVFYLSPNDVSFWGLDSAWSRAEEMSCCDNVFSGDTGMRPGGAFQAPVDARFGFGLSLKPVEQTWEMTKRVDEPFAGALARRYDQLMLVQYTTIDFDFIGSRQEFYIGAVDVTGEDGGPARRYVLHAWQDLGIPNPDLRHGTWSWGYFKSIFRGALP